jgi:cation diffusion facilitator family transporter
MRMSLLGVAVGAVLATVKLVAGLLGHSYALVADAIESFADLASSAIVWGGLAISAKPPDANHPYGHGKAEPLATLAVGLMLLGAAVGIAVQSVREIVAPHQAPAAFTLIVLGLVVITKEGLFRVASRVGRQIHSTAVGADAWHHRSDALTSLLAAGGISISLFAGPGYESADDWAALLATGVIVFNGTRFVRLAMSELMDEQPATQLLERVTAAAVSVAGVERVEKVLARKMGTTYLIDMHIEVAGSLPVREAHELAHGVKDQVRRQNPRVSDVLVHVEPHTPQPPTTGDARDAEAQPRA